MPSLIGFGFCLIFLPAITGIVAYFDKKKAMATGIASSGSGFGTFIFAPIIHLLNENFGWAWTLMIIGALVLLCIPLGILFKPMKDDKSHQPTENYKNVNPRDELGNKHELAPIDCIGCISACATKMGSGYIDLLVDTKFILFTLANVFINIGSAIPFVYTVVIAKREMILSRAHLSLKGYLISKSRTLDL